MSNRRTSSFMVVFFMANGSSFSGVYIERFLFKSQLQNIRILMVNEKKASKSTPVWKNQVYPLAD